MRATESRQNYLQFMAHMIRDIWKVHDEEAVFLLQK
jgi:hypothetical protein